MADGHAPAVVCDGGTMRVWTEGNRENDVAEWLTEELGRYLANVRHGQALETFLDGFDSRHTNWGRIVCAARENVALCKTHWLENENGEISVPVAEHGSDAQCDRDVPM